MWLVGPRTFVVGRRLVACLVSSALLVVAFSAISAADGDVAFIQVSSAEKRLWYLARARIWADSGPPSPDDLRAGPRGLMPSALADEIHDETLSCTFTRPGRALGGKTPKFLCRLGSGPTVRVKYTDGSEEGNREVFSLVAATRLLWALGFDADPVFPVTVECRDCPEDPMSGDGPRASRRYLGIVQPRFVETVMVDGTDPNQGWRWGEAQDAIDALPPGGVRGRQQEHFDALELAAVLLQHGDRKPEQQRLACAGPLTPGAGDVEPVVDDDSHAYSVPVLFEHPSETVCADPVIAIQDVGATFGGAGRTSNRHTAKMHLESWAEKPVFRDRDAASGDRAVECYGEITVSMAAGHDSGSHPRIGEAGRLFLLQQLRRLSDEHIRAIILAARVDQMGEAHEWRDPETDRVHAGVDAWLAAFKAKVRQIEERRCAP